MKKTFNERNGRLSVATSGIFATMPVLLGTFFRSSEFALRVQTKFEYLRKFAMKRAVVILAAVVLFSLSSNGTANAYYHHYWHRHYHHHHWHHGYYWHHRYWHHRHWRHHHWRY